MNPALLLLLAVPPHPELGRVAWLRDFEQARALAKTSQKPLLVLFDEVPGCATVRAFGKDVLSDPDVVARIERDFVPVAVFNNVGGVDREVLDSFREPTWNNPVVRVVDGDLRPLAPRFAGPYTKAAFERTLDAAAPRARKIESLTVSMPCFWECEARLGRVEAVVAARAGFLHGEEVVEVQFDVARMSRADLIREAARLDCARRVFARGDDEHHVARGIVGDRAVRTDEPLRPSEKDTKYYVRQSRRRSEGLSELELLRLNAALRFGADPDAAVAACRAEK